MIGRSLQTITHTHWFCAAWRKGLRRSLGLPHTTAIPFRYLVFLALYHCLKKYVNVLLSLLLWFSLLFCIVSLRCVTIHLFWEICVFSVKCLIGEIVILYVVGFLCHNSILLNVIVIDFLMFRRVWLVCCLNLYVLETITLCFLVILILIILVSYRSKSQPVTYKSGNLKNVDLLGHSPFTGLVNLDMSHSCATADRPYVARC